MRKLLFIGAFLLFGCASTPEIVLAKDMCVTYTLVFADTKNVSVEKRLCTCVQNPTSVLTEAIEVARDKMTIQTIRLEGTSSSCE